MSIKISVKRRPKRLLELFSGTGSVGRVAEELGYTVTSLDIDASRSATITADIMDWDYKVYEPGYFHTIWASPPCTYYSILQHGVAGHYKAKGKPYDLDALRAESDKIVARTLEIIEYFRPSQWFMENPYSGCLKNRKIVSHLKYSVADYCRYGFDYRKSTAIWSNRHLELLRCCGGKCGKMEGSRHAVRVGKSGVSTSLDQRYAIPDKLVDDLLRPYS